ncbi:MAG: hypothetical protein JEY99_09485 [Spirochaetales bacterium]|nr:hypothetical protein [Spirochaetales bacterium]
MKSDFFETLKGKTLTLQKIINDDDTYAGLLSTASLTRFMLDTSWKLLAKELPEEFTSVTAQVMVSHEEPTIAGETLTVNASVMGTVENRVFISFEAVDESGVIAHGRNERHVVEKNMLHEFAEVRAEKLRKIR